MAVTPDALYASILAVHGVSADGLQSADMAHQPTGHAFTTRLEHAIAEAFGAVLIHTRISPPEPMIHASILEARAPRTNRPTIASVPPPPRKKKQSVEDGIRSGAQPHRPAAPRKKIFAA